MMIKLENWHVSKVCSVSDHQHIRFDFESLEIRFEVHRIPKLTNLVVYEEHLGRKMQGIESSLETADELNTAATQLQTAINKAYMRLDDLKNAKAVNGDVS